MTVSHLVFDPFSEEFFNGPYDTYRRMRDEAPVYYSEQYALSRHEDVAAAYKNFETYSSARGVDLAMVRSQEPIPHKSIIVMDPPEHRQMRGLVNKVFKSRTAHRSFRIHPDRPQRAERLVEQPGPVGDVDAHRRELRTQVPGADTGDQPAAGDEVETAQRLGGEIGIAVGQDVQIGHHLDVDGGRRHEAQRRDRVQGVVATALIASGPRKSSGALGNSLGYSRVYFTGQARSAGRGSSP